MFVALEGFFGTVCGVLRDDDDDDDDDHDDDNEKKTKYARERRTTPAALIGPLPMHAGKGPTTYRRRPLAVGPHVEPRCKHEPRWDGGPCPPGCVFVFLGGATFTVGGVSSDLGRSAKVARRELTHTHIHTHARIHTYTHTHTHTHMHTHTHIYIGTCDLAQP